MNIPDDFMNIYLKSTIGKLYKILPLYEEYKETISTYIHSLKSELIGALNNFPYLANNGKFIGIINTLAYMANNEFSKEMCKREVFKCINVIEMIIKENGDTNE